MARITLLLASLLAATRVIFRRLLRGPRRPTWGLFFEIAVSISSTALARVAPGIGDKDPKSLPLEDLDEIRRATSPPEGAPNPMLRHIERKAVQIGALEADWIVPKGTWPDRVILYLHGGGYFTCSVDTHLDLMARLALASEARVLGLNYRLAPEHPFPAALDDALDAWQWLLEQGVDRERAFIAGDSAGGGLALAALLRLRDTGGQMPVGAVLMSPWVDLAGQEDPSVAAHVDLDYLGPGAKLLGLVGRLYADEMPLDHPLVSPRHADHTGLPPLLVQSGEVEILRDQIEAMVQRARQAGVSVQHDVWPDMVHVFQAFSMVCPAGRRAIRQAGAWVKALESPREVPPESQKAPGSFESKVL